MSWTGLVNFGACTRLRSARKAELRRGRAPAPYLPAVDLGMVGEGFSPSCKSVFDTAPHIIVARASSP